MKAEELERLAILAEECAEVQQIAMKIIRHGYESVHPDDPALTANRQLLEKELGDLLFAFNFMVEKRDIDKSNVMLHRDSKRKKIQRYLHHNEV